MRIRTKTAIIFLFLSLVPLTLVGTIAYHGGKEAIEENLGVSFRRIAHETIEKIDRSLYEVYRDVKTWAELESMQEVVTDDLDGQISALLMSLWQEYEYYASINVLGREGVVVASSHPALIGLDFHQTMGFKKSMEGNPHVSDVYFDEVDQAWVVGFSFPIRAKFDPGRVLGVLSAKWRAQTLHALTQPDEKSFGKSEGIDHVDLIVLRSDGLLIAGPRSEGENLFKANWIQRGLQSARRTSQKESGYLVEMDRHGLQALIGFDHSRGYRDFPGLGWGVLVVKDAQSTFSSIERLEKALLGIGAVVALCVVAISLVVTRRMTYPILKISQIAGNVARGDFEERAEYRSNDEIGGLARAFNQMIGDLKRQRSQLVDKQYVDSVIANMLNVLIVTDTSGVIKTVNRATMELLGYSEEELIGQSAGVVLTETAFQALPLKGFDEGDFTDNLETVYRTKSGEEIPVFLSRSVLYDGEQRPQGIILVAQDLTERKQAEKALSEQAIRDSLTGLYNRRYFLERMKVEMARSDREEAPLALLLCDLDGFKQVNDTRGHQAGDEVLREAVHGIQQATRGTDLVFRWGGDEIVVVLTKSNREGIMVAAERIRRSIGKVSEKFHLNLDMSIGIAMYPEHGTDLDRVIRLADRAMYIAKKGGDKIHIGEEEYSLDEQTIQVVFQPIVDIADDRIMGYEALSRDGQGNLSIQELFQRYLAIGQIGEMKRLCFESQLKETRRHRLKRVFINVDFDVLKEVGPVPRPAGAEVILEISEAEALYDIEAHLEVTEVWRKQGYQFAIDDFGAGFISLPFVARLVPEYIKVDRSTVLQAVASERFREFLAGLVSALGKYCTKGIIAEGIETEKELGIVRELGIHIVQGFLFGKPRPLSDETLL